MRQVIAVLALVSCVPVRSPVVGLQDAAGRVTCSAFAVGEHLVTAAHCVHGKRIGYVTRDLWNRTARGQLVANVAHIDREHDWAILTPPTLNGLAPLSVGQVVVGESVFTIAAKGDWVPSGGLVVTSFFAGETNGVDKLRWESTITVAPGWSGSPVINARGEVVGIVVSCTGTALDSGERVVKKCRPGLSMFVELPGL